VEVFAFGETERTFKKLAGIVKKGSMGANNGSEIKGFVVKLRNNTQDILV